MNMQLSALLTLSMLASSPRAISQSDTWKLVPTPALELLEGFENGTKSWRSGRSLSWENGVAQQRDVLVRKAQSEEREKRVLDVISTARLEGLPATWSAGSSHTLTLVLSQGALVLDHPSQPHFEAQLTSGALVQESFESGQGFTLAVARVDPDHETDRLSCTFRFPMKVSANEVQLVWNMPSLGSVTYTYVRDGVTAPESKPLQVPSARDVPAKQSEPAISAAPSSASSALGSQRGYSNAFQVAPELWLLVPEEWIRLETRMYYGASMQWVRIAGGSRDDAILDVFVLRHQVKPGADGQFLPSDRLMLERELERAIAGLRTSEAKLLAPSGDSETQLPNHFLSRFEEYLDQVSLMGDSIGERRCRTLACVTSDAIVCVTAKVSADLEDSHPQILEIPASLTFVPRESTPPWFSTVRFVLPDKIGLAFEAAPEYSVIAEWEARKEVYKAMPDEAEPCFILRRNVEGLTATFLGYSIPGGAESDDPASLRKALARTYSAAPKLGVLLQPVVVEGTELSIVKAITKSGDQVTCVVAVIKDEDLYWFTMAGALESLDALTSDMELFVRTLRRVVPIPAHIPGVPGVPASDR